MRQPLDRLSVAFRGGRPALVLVYGILAVSGLMSRPSGFVALMALPIELLFLIVLYSFRPERFRRTPYPSAVAVLGGSVPLFVFYWFIAAGVGSAMDNVVPGPDHQFLLSPFRLNAVALSGVIIGHIVAFLLEYLGLRRHPEAWTHVPQRMVTKGLSIWILAYAGVAAVWITGEDHQEWAIVCLLFARIAIEFSLRPLDDEGIGVWREKE